MSKAQKRLATIPLLTRESIIKRQLREHLRSLGYHRAESGELQPPQMTKEVIRDIHMAQRIARLEGAKPFIEDRWEKLKGHFADGTDVKPEAIAVRLELISSDTWQSDLFRLASLTWSIPVSQGYGRRMRYLIWDESNEKLIGLMALGDPVFNLKVRDAWIGWSIAQRRERLVDVMDAYVLGAVPPYNMLLGGKLVASLVATTEVRDFFATRYSESKGLISQKLKRPSLCLVTTTSALGRSAVYNRLKLAGREVFRPLGFTSGWGHFHIPDHVFASIRDYLSDADDSYANNHRFGDGPNWRLRAIRKALRRIGMSPDLLRHGIMRQVFGSLLATNALEVLRGDSTEPDYQDLPSAATVCALAKERWLVPRAQRRQEFRTWKREAVLDLLTRPSMTSCVQRCTNLVGGSP